MNLSMKVALALSAVMFASTACAAPKTEADDRARVEELLRGIHGLPEQSRFEAAAADPAKVLRVVAADELAGPMRTAALEALMWWPDPATLDVYRAALAPKNSKGVRYKTVRYLKAFGEQAIPLATDLSKDSDPMVRRLAGELLFEIPGPAAGSALAAAAAAEADPSVKAELDALIQRRNSIR